MMRLTTLSTPIDKDTAAVMWSVGLERKGKIEVKNIPEKDALVIAELLAIRYLLFDMSIFDRKLITGKGIELFVSSPVIKKLSRGKSSKTHLIPYASFLYINLPEIKISDTPKNTDILPLVDDANGIEIIEESMLDTEYDVLDTPAIGRVRITIHAVEQYSKLLHSGDPGNPRASLIKRLGNQGLIAQSIPDNVLKHKLKKYGDVDTLEIWNHPNSQMHYLVIRDPLTKIGQVRTVFYRHTEFR